MLFDLTQASFTIEDPLVGKEGVIRFTLEFAPEGPPEETRTVELLIKDNKQDIVGVPVHSGLLLSAEAEAASLDDAVTEARNLLMATLSFLALAGNTTVATEGLHLVAAREPTANGQATECLAVEELGVPMFENRRRVPEWAVTELPVLVGKLYAADERVGRAIAWYQRGMNQGNIVDRLLMFWMGLENLDPLLRQKVGEEPEIRQCARCGLDYEVPVAKGVKALFRDYSPNGLSDFKVVRNLRVDVVHGRALLSEVLEGIQRAGATEICRKALRTAILLMLDMAEWIAEDPAPILNLGKPRIECRILYAATPTSVVEFPRLQWTAQPYILDGKRGATSNCKVVGNQGVPVTECRRHYYSEAGLDISEVSDNQGVD